MKSTLPDFGVEIKCPDGGCNGLPCKIDPSDGKGKVESDESAVGAGNSAFCVVTVPKGSTAQIVAFSVGSGSGSDDSDDSDSDDGEMGIKKVEESSTTEKAKPSTTTTVAETTTSEKTTSTTEEATSTTEESTTTSEAPTTSSEETTSTTSIESTTTTSEESTTTEESTSSTPTTSSTSKVHKSSTKAVTTTKVTTTKKVAPTVKPGIFHENGTTTFTGAQVTEKPAATEAGSEAAPTQSKEGEAGRHQGNAAVAGLVVAFIAAACFF